MKYIIKDWAGNVLDFKGRFNLPQFAVPMEFEDFEDAEMYLDGRGVTEEERDDLFVEEK